MIRSLLWIEDPAHIDNRARDLAALLRQYFPRAKLQYAAPTQVRDMDLAKNDSELIVTNEDTIACQARQAGKEVILWEKSSDLSASLDEFLQLQRYLKKYPLKLHDWKLNEVLHNGRDAVIFRGVNRSGDSVAIKRFKYNLQNLSQTSVQPFLQRIDVQCRLNARGLVSIFEGGVCNHAFYLIMEYMPHGTLRQSLKSCGPLPLQHALQWFSEIAESLACVHKSGLLHRDLKPDNIMLRDDGSLALSDYGVSKQVLLDMGFISEHDIQCSPYYVSPEQVSGDVCTPASDIYSLGVILYELLTGTRPYHAKQAYELMIQHVMAPLPRLPDALGKYQPLLNRMMDKDPGKRFYRVSEVIEYLPLAA